MSERVWYYPYESERDRPNLGYIKGDNWSLAVDAGHSATHFACENQLQEKQSQNI